MSINGILHEISLADLETFKQDQFLVNEFIDDSGSSGELRLDQYFDCLTYLLAGYNPGYISSDLTTISEIRTNEKLMQASENKDFIPFTIIEASKWDGLPLVNAFGAGTEIGEEMGYGLARYISPEQVKEISNGLSEIGEEGFQSRLSKASEDENLPFDLDEEIQEYLLEYFNEMLDYYQNASSRNSAMLLYLI